MKTNFLFLVVLMILLNTTSKAQLYQGDIMIDAYYGVPNLYNAVLKPVVKTIGVENLTTTGIDAVGIRGEYMILDRVSIGLDLGFNNTVIKFDEEVTVDTFTQRLTGKVTTYKISGIASTFFHFFPDNDNIDLALGGGLGFGNRVFDFEINDPTKSFNFNVPFPLAYRVALQFRYFFTPNIGINAGLGIGLGNLLNAGISAKF